MGKCYFHTSDKSHFLWFKCDVSHTTTTSTRMGYNFPSEYTFQGIILIMNYDATFNGMLPKYQGTLIQIPHLIKHNISISIVDLS